MLKMNDKRPDYGVIAGNCLAPSVSKAKIPLGDRTLLLGSVVKVEGEYGSSRYAVRLLKADGESWESLTFTVQKDNVIGINEKLWPFLAAVNSPMERVKVAKDKKRCEKLLHLSDEMIVGFKDTNGVCLGTIKYIGNVKGIGKCFGIRLHDKKPNNKCTGSCAGIQYFNCLPGYGIFTTIEQIIPPTDIYQKTQQCTDIDDCIERNVARLSIRPPPADDSPEKPHHEEIVTRYMDYPKTRTAEEPNRSSLFRTSLSLQNILDPSEDYSVNTNNDFDQNSVLQPEKTYLLRDADKHAAVGNNKTKSEVDLIDAIGGTWAGSTDQKQLESFANLRKNLDKNENVNNYRSSYTNGVSKNSRNKSLDIISHLVEGSKTLPKKAKLLQESITNGKDSKKEEKPTSTFFLELNERAETSKPSTSHSKAIYHDPEPGSTNDFTVGSLVEVSNDVSDDPLYGVIRWLGAEEQSKFVLVGVELEEEQSHLPLTLTDGTHNGERYFKCAENRALFVPLRQCHRDSRFQDGTPTPVHQVSEKVFDKECPIIQGSVAPLCMPTEEDVEAVCGKFRGIQGHHNSCYLDVTLFAMFTYTAVFDSLLFRPKGPNDISHYEEVQRVLREEIVNPLRKNLFVRADRVMNLRRLLDQLSSVQGLTCEEKDPEEFLNSLLAQILKAKPYLKLNSGQEAYHYQLFVEKDDELSLPTVQQLFEQSFLTSDIKLKEVPSCLIIQMPRFGKSYKMYPRILPSQLLDVTDVIEDSPRQCIVCGKLARWECRECFGEHEGGLESTAFCTECRDKTHCHVKRAGHHPKPLKVSPDFAIMEDHCPPPRLFMELFAVICIETSHYVAFVKCGVGHEAPWCFFDSMADRKGEKNGYNIPEMVACPDISKWLSDEQACRRLHANSPLDRHLPEHARRLLCDAYICMYQSPDVMMYR